jgi:hypothetical protein
MPKISIDIPAQTIADMFIGAFEGGSNYWIESARLITGKSSESPWYADPKLYESPLFKIRIKHDGQRAEISRGKIAKGLRLMAEKSPQHFGDMLSESNADSITADVFLQYVALGEIVYG